jgi:hypothetical protein
MDAAVRKIARLIPVMISTNQKTSRNFRSCKSICGYCEGDRPARLSRR